MTAAVQIPLLRGGFALVDSSDADLVNQYRWRRHPSRASVYAISYIDGRNVLMHRLLLDLPVGSYIDHINRDGLDNQRSNFRLCSVAENARNRAKSARRKYSSRFKGVSYFAQAGVWRAAICKANEQHHLGQFATEADAAHAYDDAARRLFGEFAVLNFPTMSAVA